MNIPIENKFILSVPEASQYFSINQQKIRDIVRNNAEYNLYLTNGNRILIKRSKFESFINSVEAV